MKISKIIIILGEPQSVFSEILFKYLNQINSQKNKKKSSFDRKCKLIIKTDEKIKI